MEERLFQLVLPELHVLARRLTRKERREHTLQPSALLNEAYLRLLASRERDWEGRRHFFAVAARIMRRLLIDYARAHIPTEKIPLDAHPESLRAADNQLELAVAVDLLLDELDHTHPEWCSIVEFKYFMGFTDEETADALGLPLRTTQRRFGDARRWLFEKLKPSPCCKNTNATNS